MISNNNGEVDMNTRQIVLRFLIAFFVMLCPFYQASPESNRSAITDRKEQINPATLMARLYRGGNTPELLDFTAEFRVKKNISGKETQSPAALENFIKGKIYFRTPNKLRVDSSVVISDMMFGEEFVVIRDGTTEWIFKNKYDYFW